MKKYLALICALLMIVSLCACGASQESKISGPDDDTIKGDIQSYIQDMIDDSAQVTTMEKTSVEEDGSNVIIKCNAVYKGKNGLEQGDFTLTYSRKGNDFKLVKCRANLEEEDKTTVADSDNLYDFVFTLDGTKYQLPFAFTDLTDNGWTITSNDASSESEISANSYEYLNMAKDGHKITVYIINPSGNVKTVKECRVGGVEVETYYLGDNGLFSMAKGINLESTQEDITAAFGSASSTNSYDDHTRLSYQKGDYVDVDFNVYNEDTKYNSIRLRNYVSDDSDATETSTKVPDYLSEYVAPAELGSDLLSGNIQIDGELYRLPAPVSEFLDHDWRITQKPDGIGAGNTESITVQKGDTKLTLNVINLASYQTTPENCAVYGVYISDYDKIQVLLPGEITIGTEKSVVEAAVTEDFSYDKGSNSYTYSYYAPSGKDYSVTIRVDIATEKVTNISLRTKDWVY